MLSAPSDEAAKGYAAARFAEALGLRSEEDWRRLDGEFSAWLARLLDAPPAAAAPPPALADWPGYVPHEPVDPRSW